jgi:predicted peptidase
VFLEFEDPAGIGTGTHNTLQYKDGGNVLRDLTIDVQCLYDMNLYAVKGYIHTEIDDYLALSETAGDYTTDYRLFVPKGWEGEKLPLVIWLHGAGERGCI